MDHKHLTTRESEVITGHTNCHKKLGKAKAGGSDGENPKMTTPTRTIPRGPENKNMPARPKMTLENMLANAMTLTSKGVTLPLPAAAAARSTPVPKKKP